MARSDKVPFRREFTITETTGYAGGDEGHFVGDIQALHIDFSMSQVSVLIEGKVGRAGDWEIIEKASNIGFIKDINISSYEYIRVLITPINIPSVTVIIFGYEPPPKQEVVPVEQSVRDNKISTSQLDILERILIELESINTHMSMVTGEENANK